MHPWKSPTRLATNIIAARHWLRRQRCTNGKYRKKERHCDKSSRSTGIEHSRRRFSHTCRKPIGSYGSVGNPETSANPRHAPRWSMTEEITDCRRHHDRSSIFSLCLTFRSRPLSRSLPSTAFLAIIIRDNAESASALWGASSRRTQLEWRICSGNRGRSTWDNSLNCQLWMSNGYCLDFKDCRLGCLLFSKMFETVLHSWSVMAIASWNWSDYQ